MEQMILETKGVSKHYAGHTALNQVSISVPEGKIYGLLGPNGAGKTTLIRIINQITGPDEGEVLFNQNQLNSSHIGMIGYLPEERGLYKKMKVGEQCMYLARLKGLSASHAKGELKKWFEKFEISSWWNKKVEELSKGMQQKVQFITTVLHQPSLLILDEPFSGFDPINTNLIKKEILELKDQGTSVIFSTHNMSSVEEICDHIALINKSEKILEGRVDDIKNTYKSNIFEIEFSGNMLAFTNALWTSAEIVSQDHPKEGKIKVKVKISQDSNINQVLQSVLPVISINSVNENLPSMNEIFIQKVTEEKTGDDEKNIDVLNNG